MKRRLHDIFEPCKRFEHSNDHTGVLLVEGATATAAAPVADTGSVSEALFAKHGSLTRCAT